MRGLAIAVTPGTTSVMARATVAGSSPGCTLTITDETLSLGMRSGRTAVVSELRAMASAVGRVMKRLRSRFVPVGSSLPRSHMV